MDINRPRAGIRTLGIVLVALVSITPIAGMNGLGSTASPTVSPVSATLGQSVVTVIRKVTQGADDSGMINGAFDATSTTLTIGKIGQSPATNFVLFRHIPVPQGSTIEDARLHFTVLDGDLPHATAIIKANDTGNAVAPTSASDFSRKSLTAASVSWPDLATGAPGREVTSPSLTSVVQSIIDRPDWASGNAIMLWIGDNNSETDAHRTVASRNSGHRTQFPSLTITYHRASPPPGSARPYRITFTADRSAVPTNINYAELSYIITVGHASRVTAKVDTVVVPITYSAQDGTAVLTTSGHAIEIDVDNPDDPAVFTVQKAVLKDNKNWVWSHGLDDNEYLKAQINLFKAVGWRATLYLIGSYISDTRTEDWIVDAPDIKDLIALQWGIGNHTWSHDCNTSDPYSILQREVMQGYNRLHGIIATSSNPKYRLNAFAAPCFIAGYTPVIADDRASTDVKFNETSTDALMLVDTMVDDGQRYTTGGYSARKIDFNSAIGRDVNLQNTAQSGLAEMDWVNAQSNSTRHIWFNSVSHGNAEGQLSQVIRHAYTLYGPNGTNVLWVAPADEVYAYLLTRENTRLSPPVVTQ